MISIIYSNVSSAGIISAKLAALILERIDADKINIGRYK